MARTLQSVLAELEEFDCENNIAYQNLVNDFSTRVDLIRDMIAAHDEGAGNLLITRIEALKTRRIRHFIRTSIAGHPEQGRFDDELDELVAPYTQDARFNLAQIQGHRNAISDTFDAIMECIELCISRAPVAPVAPVAGAGAAAHAPLTGGRRKTRKTRKARKARKERKARKARKTRRQNNRKSRR